MKREDEIEQEKWKHERLMDIPGIEIDVGYKEMIGFYRGLCWVLEKKPKEAKS